MNSSVDGTPPIDIDTLSGKRYTIEQMKPVLLPHLDLSANTVPAHVAEEIRKLLDGKQTNIIPLKNGNAAKLSVINNPERGLSINIMQVQARLQLRDNYLGHTFTAHDKENLQRYGDMGRAVSLIDQQTGLPFKGLLGIDKETNRITVINVDKFTIPDKMLGVAISQADKDRLREGYSIRLNNLKKEDNATFSAFVRIAASKKGFRFDRVKPPKLEQIARPQQAMSQPITDRPTSRTPLVDKLTFPSKGLAQTIKSYTHGIETMIIRQPGPDQYVVSISVPEKNRTPEELRPFALPVMASKADTEALLKLSEAVDKAIGKNQPLLPAFKTAPESVQRLLNMDFLRPVVVLNTEKQQPDAGPLPSVRPETKLDKADQAESRKSTPTPATKQDGNDITPAPGQTSTKGSKVVKSAPDPATKLEQSPPSQDPSQTPKKGIRRQ